MTAESLIEKLKDCFCCSKWHGCVQFYSYLCLLAELMPQTSGIMFVEVLEVSREKPPE